MIIQTAIGEVSLAAVAGGGGDTDSEIASGYILEMLSNWFYGELIDILKRSINQNTVVNSLLRVIKKSEMKLAAYNEQNHTHLRFSLGLILGIAKRSIWLTMGGCRLYLIKPTSQKLIHKEADLWIRKKRIIRKQSYLLCTSGYSDSVCMDHILSTLSSNIKTNESVCKTLKTFATRKSNPSQNSMSAIYLHY